MCIRDSIWVMDEQEMIEMAFDDLIKSLRKGTTEESVKMIRRAFEFAREAHQGVRRKSGEPYILHPLAVAKIAVKEIGLGTKSVSYTHLDVYKRQILV